MSGIETEKQECPKDADTTPLAFHCNATTKRKNHKWPWYCTRKAGHEGQHHAHGIRKGYKACCAVWD